MSGSWNDHFLALGQEGPDGPTTEVWWKVPQVHGEPCPEPASTEEDAMPRYVDYPSPSAAFEMIRSMPEFDVSPERPFSFAGATGRSVDLRLSPEGRARCAPRGGAWLIAARGSAPCCEWSFPLDAVVRIATVNVAGLDLFITVVAPTVDDLDRANAVLETFSAEVRSTSTPAGPLESPREPQPAPPSDPAGLVFRDDGRLHAIRPDGTGHEIVLDGTARQIGVDGYVPSPDRRSIAFLSRDDAGTSVFVRDETGRADLGRRGRRGLIAHLVT